MSRDEELKNEGLTASFLISIEDVTEKILGELNDNLSEKERSAKIRSASKTIVEEKISNSKKNNYIMYYYNSI